MGTGLQKGMQGHSTCRVTPDMLASAVGSGDVSVFSTAMLVAHMEGTAVALVQAFLKDGETTVGTGINITHVSATPVGMEVRCTAELTDISANGKKLTFHVTASDAAGRIGEGSHTRVVVNRQRFEQKAAAKAEAHHA